MSNLIFGHTWEEIKAMQQGTFIRPVVTGAPNRPTASQADIDMLRDKGLDYICGNGLHGVLDRLQNSGIIPRDI